MLGRPLQAGKWAILMLNNNVEEATITCGKACFAAMNIRVPSGGAKLTDVWGGDLGVVSKPLFSLVVPPRGGSRLVVLG